MRPTSPLTLTLTLLLALGCSNPEPPPSPSKTRETTARAEPPAPTRDPTTPPTPPQEPPPPAPAGPTPKHGPAETLELSRHPSALLKPGARVVRGKPLLQGGHYEVREATTDLLIARESNRSGEQRSYVAIDLKNGARLGRYPSIRSMDLERGLLVTRDAQGGLALTHVRDGASLTPQVALGDQQQARTWDIRLTDPVLVAATAGDTGETWVGLWRDLRSPQVDAPLKFPLLLNRYAIQGDAATVSRGRARPARFAAPEAPCARWRVPLTALDSPDPAAARCLERGEPRPGGQESYELAGGWTFWTGGFPGDPKVFRGDGPAHDLTVEGCNARFHAALADPPRVLVGCNAEKGAGRHMLLWSPEREWTWQEPPPDDPRQFNTFRVTGEIESPVMDGVEWDTKRTWVTRWIDLRRGAIWRGPKLDPAGYRSYDDQTLAVAPIASKGANTPNTELVQLDFKTGTYEPLLALDDRACSIELSFRDGDRVVLTCASQPDPSLYVFKHHETLILDLKRRLYWRTPLYPEALLSDGAVIVSNRTQSAAESSSPATAVYRLRLE